MDERLRRIAQAGDINGLYSCIREDANVLRHIDEAEFVDTPLHIAALRGHTDFTVAIMHLKPSFATRLNQDANSPIHLALQNDHRETILRLLNVDMNLVRVKGKDGYTIFHHVVEDGNLEFLTQFLKVCPECVEDLTIRNETALHIAAKSYRLDVLEILVRWILRNDMYCKVSRNHLFNSKDSDGNTVLHIASYNTQPQMIKLLLECKVDMKEINKDNLTALDILERQDRTRNREICLKILRNKGALNASSISRSIVPTYKSLQLKITLFEEISMGLLGPIMNMSPERINTLLVGLTLIITAIYSAILNPPGGVWQGDAGEPGVGNSVMDPVTFQAFFAVNYAVYIFAAFSVVVLIQVVTSSAAIGIMAEILAALFTCSFVGAWLVIVPENADFFIDILHLPNLSRALELKLGPLYFLFLLASMEGCRRLCLMFKRWYDQV